MTPFFKSSYSGHTNYDGRRYQTMDGAYNIWIREAERIAALSWNFDTDTRRFLQMDRMATVLRKVNQDSGGSDTLQGRLGLRKL
jgi:hypothetical protein